MSRKVSKSTAPPNGLLVVNTPETVTETVAQNTVEATDLTVYPGS